MLSLQRRWSFAFVGVLVAACSGDIETRDDRPGRPSNKVKLARVESRPPSEDRLLWTGCDISRKAYMTEAAESYLKEAGVRIVITGGGASRGIRATAGGQFDIGGTCRQCLPDVEAQEAGVVLTHVAWDALVFFTSSDNPVEGISWAEAKSILLGRIVSWGEIGGPDKKIILAFRRQTKRGKLSGVGYMTRLLLFGDPDVEYTYKALSYRSSRPIEEFVEDTPFSFAVTGVSSANKRNVKRLALDGVVASKANIASGSYKLFRPLYLVTKREPNVATRKFLDWIVGPNGQRVLSAEGTVSLAEGRALEDLYQHWPADKSLIRNR